MSVHPMAGPVGLLFMCAIPLYAVNTKNPMILYALGFGGDQFWMDKATYATATTYSRPPHPSTTHLLHPPPLSLTGFTRRTTRRVATLASSQMTAA